MASGLLGICFSFAEFPLTARDSFDLGTWTVDKPQICEMGYCVPDEVYVHVTGQDLGLKHG